MQTIISYVRRLRLGGKSYAPTAKHPLAEFNKELCEFVTLWDKIQTKLEEEKNEREAVVKVLNLLKFLAKKTTILKSNEIERAFDNALKTINDLTEDSEKQLRLNSTPNRLVGSGGSMVGRKAIKVSNLKSGVVNDPLGQPHTTGIEDRCCFSDYKKWGLGDGRTTCLHIVILPAVSGSA